jgi:hypothetical protein
LGLGLKKRIRRKSGALFLYFLPEMIKFIRNMPKFDWAKERNGH